MHIEEGISVPSFFSGQYYGILYRKRLFCLCNIGTPVKAGVSILNHEWEDKAGAYAIQGKFGARYVSGIVGDYNNVVGLPICRLYNELKRMKLLNE